MSNSSKTSLLGLSQEALTTICTKLGAKPFVGKQMAQWLYGKRVKSISQMSNVPKSLRETLSEQYEVGRKAPIKEQASSDGTKKYLFPTSDGFTVETVYIPDGERGTLCVSCQVGCKMGCAFCMTGRQGFQSSLSACDIVNQILSVPEYEQLTNIVFMGQGEPLDNLDNVLAATGVLTASWGLGWSPRRITISTVGLRKNFKRLINECKCHIAISLHNPRSEERARLMPAESAFSIRDITSELLPYWGKQADNRDMQRRLSFEYIVFRGENDTMRHAEALVSLLHGLDCRVNLIRFHAIPDSPLQGALESTMVRLRDYLTAHSIFTTIRASRGEDIQAACGLLNTEHQKNNS